MLNNRNSWTSLCLGLLLLGLASQASASMNVELLRADFNDKPLNVQIGAGGASVGEPVSVPTDLIAKVQAAPFASPSLHFKADTVGARYARFDFIGAEEIHSGELRISFTLRTPPLLDRFRVWVRDQATATAILGGLDFLPNGNIQTLESPTFIATYAPNQTLHVEYVYQVAANSYDLFINGVQKFDDRAQSSATIDKGIGALQFGFPTNTGSDEWAVDDILVVRTPALLNADFNDRPLNTQIGSGGAVVGEPIEVTSSNLSAIVETGHFATPALRMEQSTTGVTKSARFEFLNNREIVNGELRMSLRVLTAPVSDSFLVYIRQQGSDSLSYGGLRFESTGGISALDANGSVATSSSYMPGDALLIEWRYALDAGTYDVYVNRALALDDRPHGVTAVGRGIGRFNLFTHATTTSHWVFDDLYVYQPGVIFQDGYD